MGKARSPKEIAKFLSYVLGRRPDEFGLVPDENGYVKIKELIKAVCEENGWKSFRKASIQEVLLTVEEPPIEVDDNRIRAKIRDKIVIPQDVEQPPKLLFTCVRRKAHPFVIENGIRPMGHDYILLSSDETLAKRIGERIDRPPVMLTVQTQACLDHGVSFKKIGECLFLAAYIPPVCFSAPPLPKEKPEAKKKEPTPVEPPRHAGSIILDVSDEPKNSKLDKRERKKREISKTKEKRWLRQQKQKGWE